MLMQRAVGPQGRPLKTGQVTQYGGYNDDGLLRRGVARGPYTILSAGQYAGTTNITLNAKTDVHSNNCVFDESTGLMWSRYESASVGPASDGRLPWTTTGAGATAEGIFAFADAANLAGLAGHNDWRVSNLLELVALMVWEAPSIAPDPVAFPVYGNNVWTSTTRPSLITAAFWISSSQIAQNAKTGNGFCLLVRGGV